MKYIFNKLKITIEKSDKND